MSKYDPLTAFLRLQSGRPFRMTFAEIERVIGAGLPAASKTVRTWWSNNPNNSQLTKAWLAAGYKTANVDIVGEKLSFVPARSTEGFDEMEQSEFAGKAKPQGKSSLFGSLKGTTIVMPGVDLTAPADPDWAKVYDNDYDPQQMEVDRIKANIGLSTIGKVWALHDLGLTMSEITSALAISTRHIEEAIAARAKERGW